MKVIKAPHSTNNVTNTKVFLAGTIDMGKSVDWQEDLANRFEKYDVTFLNPRRTNWDSSWKQSITNPHFKQQVQWESDNLEDADIIVMNLLPDSQSIISIGELGEYGGKGKNMVVCCPEGFWRKGNVEFLCEKFSLPLFTDYDLMVNHLKNIIK